MVLKKFAFKLYIGTTGRAFLGLTLSPPSVIHTSSLFTVSLSAKSVETSTLNCYGYMQGYM